MDEIIDFAIVGGGVAGMYAAWRLAFAQASTLEKLTPNGSGERTIHVFESENRGGGRLLTARMPATSFLAELGGMRYTNKHLFLSKLIQHPSLELTEKPFRFDTCLMYLRGHHLRETAHRTGQCPTCSGSLPYAVEPDEIGKSPGDVVKHAIKRALMNVQLPDQDSETEIGSLGRKLKALTELPDEKMSASFLKPRQWQLLKQWGVIQIAHVDAHLYEIGFWNLLQHYLSSEAFLFVHDALGYESIVANWNAAEAIPWFLKDFAVDYLTLKEGMDAVPTRLYGQFEVERPGCRHLDHELVQVGFVDGGGEPLIELTLRIKPTMEFVTRRARHVILAIPKGPLKHIFERTDFEQLKDDLDSVTAHPLFKLFLVYDRAWWEDTRALGSASGRATTDQPIRQVYYFGPNESAALHQSSDRRGAMVMASYSDEHYVDFWKPLQEGASELYTAVQLEPEEIPIWESYGVSKRAAWKAHGQIERLHPGLTEDEIPKPLVGLVLPWLEGWHSWNVHEKPWENMRRLTRPLDANLYICGEAYSSEQGWIEGALKSVEKVMKELGIPEPGWISENIYRLGEYSGYEDYIDGS